MKTAKYWERKAEEMCIHDGCSACSNCWLKVIELAQREAHATGYKEGYDDQMRARILDAKERTK